jgi:hypothetical protein
METEKNHFCSFHQKHYQLDPCDDCLADLRRFEETRHRPSGRFIGADYPGQREALQKLPGLRLGTPRRQNKNKRKDVR